MIKAFWPLISGGSKVKVPLDSGRTECNPSRVNSPRNVFFKAIEKKEKNMFYFTSFPQAYMMWGEVIPLLLKPSSMLSSQPDLITVTSVMVYHTKLLVNFSTSRTLRPACSHTLIPVIPVLWNLCWLPIRYCVQFKILPLTFKELFNRAQPGSLISNSSEEHVISPLTQTKCWT